MNCTLDIQFQTSLRLFWKFQIAWGQISFLLGLLGNVFTLYATTTHNAIKLDKMSIWIIKNLAVADICNCFLVLLPILLYQYGKINGLIVYGKNFNTIIACYKYTFFVANLYLVNLLSLNKLVRCLYPLRNLVPTKRPKIIVTMTAVFFSLVPTVWIAYGIKDGFLSMSHDWICPDNLYFGAAYFGFTSYQSDIISQTNALIHFITICTLNGLPCLTLVILNATLVFVAMAKSNSTINKTNVLIVVLVTVGFLISILPHFVQFFLFNQLSLWDGVFHEEIAWSLTYFSTWINPFIYLAVNPSFKKFTAGRIFFWKESRLFTKR